MPTTLSVTRPATRSTSSGFFSLPFELRLDIYERYLYPYHHGDIDDATVVSPWSGWEAVRLLEVCKQIYEEASPIVYQKMDISCNLEEWKRFLTKIGPRNIAKIQHLTITYTCSPDYKSPCLGLGAKEEDHWSYILGLFKLAQADSRLKTLILNIFPCHGTWLGTNELCRIPTTFTNCHVYNDLQFLKNLSCFSDAQEIILKNRFNPLWGAFLRKRPGFIAKRHDGGNITLINLNRFDRVLDLDGYKPSELYDGVYDEVIKEEPEESDTDSDADDDEWDIYAEVDAENADPLEDLSWSF
ncbi:uncharacterized protein F4807DRAFT_464308 [Annulohypoxylon truncatum]|uniref:uncharacterized protein n=1 Tax=Annulohypoxylon truncatum TaxID=327061 RepID=UPI002007811A|nr:uncharacterized protein F4807DRAFT_464308 [Annulohypoxylon truncatum]KAI1205846.1 hypothetical protein F4807DRAFT_464308 [Annulohypoxylon truncatum]